MRACSDIGVSCLYEDTASTSKEKYFIICILNDGRLDRRHILVSNFRQVDTENVDGPFQTPASSLHFIQGSSDNFQLMQRPPWLVSHRAPGLATPSTIRWRLKDCLEQVLDSYIPALSHPSIAEHVWYQLLYSHVALSRGTLTNSFIAFLVFNQFISMRTTTRERQTSIGSLP
ncbi:hypothetical protein AcW1_002433 [Taiwanofungus camphoratus]|nr:hypothetical protein AcW1_002433 [Antrodia cinnamomea]